MALFQEMDLMEQKTRETDVKLDDVPKQVTLPHPGTSGTMTGDESSDPTVRSFFYALQRYRAKYESHDKFPQREKWNL